MIAIYIISLVVTLLVSASTIWQMNRVYQARLLSTELDNKDLRDRLFAKNQLPPSGVNLTQVYEERKDAAKQHSDKRKSDGKAYGPIEQLERKFAEIDRKEAEKAN